MNVVLCFVVSALLALGVFEAGLRVLGKGPTPSINQFDPVTGWSKTPLAQAERQTGEFHVHYAINALGLRDDPMTSPAKPAGSTRVLVLGDSFVLGYTVERADLFVDQLENWWQAEGRRVDVVNAGTEGWSTDQEVAWFETYGAAFEPDVVVLCPYENDLYWNSQTYYRRFPKPRYTPFGDRERAVLTDPGPRRWYESTAIGATWTAMQDRPLTWTLDGKARLNMEHAAYFLSPPEFMKEAIARTRGALVALKAACAARGAKLVMAPIPAKVSVDPRAREYLSEALNPRSFTQRLQIWRDWPVIDPASWSPDQPVETFLALAKDVGIHAVDARPYLREKFKDGRPLYFQSDWHLNPHGNRAFAEFLHDEIDRAQLLPAATIQAAMPREIVEPPRSAALYWFGGLWLALSALYAFTYRDTPWWKAMLGVGALLGLVFGIVLGGGALLKLMPAKYSTALLVLGVLALFGFIAYKLGRRITTTLELLRAFTLRGHWYLLPLVVILLTIGSLLVVAASSPLIAPFIYTLF
ncbi:MAG: hypothetical protein JNL28_02245 [Planctomycetes bacterium]|nr:hypothetical protein [Planctomycetota bacterium]